MNFKVFKIQVDAFYPNFIEVGRVTAKNAEEAIEKGRKFTHAPAVQDVEWKAPVWEQRYD